MAAKAKTCLFLYEIHAKKSYSYGLWHGTMADFRRTILGKGNKLTRRKDIRQTSPTGRRLIGLLGMDQANHESAIGNALNDLVYLALELS